MAQLPLSEQDMLVDRGAGFITRAEELAYELKVEQVMTRDVKTVTPRTLIIDVLNLFREARISGAPVVDQDRLVGVISIEDLIRALRDSGRSELRASVSDYMTTRLVTVNVYDSIIEALKLFAKTKLGRLLVVDRAGRLAGIITKGDITRGLLNALQRDIETEELKRYRASHLFEDIISDRTSLILRYHIAPRDFINGGAASSNIKRALLRLGANPQLARRCGVAVYEAEMNLIIHATNGGDIEVEIEPHQIVIHVTDDGPGIEDIEQAMQPGFSTAPPEIRELGFGAGMGLQNIKRSVDELNIESTPARPRLIMKPKRGREEWELSREPAPGQGTRLTMKFFLQADQSLERHSSTGRESAE
ncbi:MAG: CBS domain-containing protein [Chloroflexi bacterium]|nr:MAG: CBS domain-containing protein [Chloroflexota bacterium]